MSYKIWIAGIWGEPILKAVSGLMKQGNAEILYNDFKAYECLHRIYRFLNRRMWGKVGVQIIYHLLETPILDARYKLSSCNFNAYQQNYVVVFNSALRHYYSKGYFERLKKRNSNIKIILYIIDPMPEGIWERISKMLVCFDKVLTAHPYNSKRYGFDYFPYIYTRPSVATLDLNPKADLFFCGVIDEYRYQIVCDILKSCKKNTVKYDMQLFKTEKFKEIEDEDVHYGLISYDENIERGIESNCILEIVRKDFIGFTQRYFEAIVFDKKLLTNNPMIKEMPYYNSDYMYYFEKVDNIDWTWVKKVVDVDYQYSGEFEPENWEKRMIEKIG